MGAASRFEQMRVLSRERARSGIAGDGRPANLTRRKKAGIRCQSVSARYAGRPSPVSELGQDNRLLSLIFSFFVRIGDQALLVGFKEKNLGYALIGVDLGGQRGRI